MIRRLLNRLMDSLDGVMSPKQGELFGALFFFACFAWSWASDHQGPKAFWVVAFLCALAAGTVWVYLSDELPEELREEWTAKGRCPNCGYDLTGNVSGVCPECGAAKA